MKAIFKIIFLLFCFCLAGNIRAQADRVAELKRALESSKDTARCVILHELSEKASDDEWPGFNLQLKQLCEEKLKGIDKYHPEYVFYKRHYTRALNNEGFLLQSEGKIREAIELFKKNSKIQEEIGDRQGYYVSLSNIGALYEEQGQIKQALENYNKALILGESIGDKPGIAHIFINMGKTYFLLEQLDEATNFTQRGLRLYQELNDKRGIAMALGNLGSFKDHLKLYDEALQYSFECLKLKEELGNVEGSALTLNNIGTTYNKKGEPLKALDFFLRALEINNKSGKKPDIAHSFRYLSNTYFKIGLLNSSQSNTHFSQALSYGNKSMSIAKEIGLPRDISETARILSDIYNAQGKYKESLENYELYILMRDSINNIDTRKAGIKSQLKYDYEKQAAADSIAHAKENEIKNAELKKQNAEIRAKRNQQYVLFGGLALFLVLSGFIVKRFRLTQKQKLIIETKEKEAQKQNEIISRQKHIVEEKQKEILDSIKYAKRIQVALITSEKYIEKTMNKLK